MNNYRQIKGNNYRKIKENNYRKIKENNYRKIKDRYNNHGTIILNNQRQLIKIVVNLSI